MEQLKHCQRIVEAILQGSVPPSIGEEMCKVADLLGAVTENGGFNIEASKDYTKQITK